MVGRTKGGKPERAVSGRDKEKAVGEIGFGEGTGGEGFTECKSEETPDGIANVNEWKEKERGEAEGELDEEGIPRDENGEGDGLGETSGLSEPSGEEGDGRKGDGEAEVWIDRAGTERDKGASDGDGIKTGG